jgi:hypothetical protein
VKNSATTRRSAVGNTHPGNSRPKRNWAKCEKSGKRRYRDWNDAKLALRAASFVRATAEVNGVSCTWSIQRSYFCDLCEGWHVTSRP